MLSHNRRFMWAVWVCLPRWLPSAPRLLLLSQSHTPLFAGCADLPPRPLAATVWYIQAVQAGMRPSSGTLSLQHIEVPRNVTSQTRARGQVLLRRTPDIWVSRFTSAHSLRRFLPKRLGDASSPPDTHPSSSTEKRHALLPISCADLSIQRSGQANFQ